MFEKETQELPSDFLLFHCLLLYIIFVFYSCTEVGRTLPERFWPSSEVGRALPEGRTVPDGGA